MSDSISRQAAIELVRDVCDAVMGGCESWYDPETGDEVYKDIREVDAILKCNKEVRIALRNMPSVQPEIIRCKDCRWYKTNYSWNGQEHKVCVIEPYEPIRKSDDFCSRAEPYKGEQE